MQKCLRRMMLRLLLLLLKPLMAKDLEKESEIRDRSKERDIVEVEAIEMAILISERFCFGV